MDLALQKQGESKVKLKHWIDDENIQIYNQIQSEEIRISTYYPGLGAIYIPKKHIPEVIKVLQNIVATEGKAK